MTSHCTQWVCIQRSFSLWVSWTSGGARSTPYRTRCRSQRRRVQRHRQRSRWSATASPLQNVTFKQWLQHQPQRISNYTVLSLPITREQWWFPVNGEGNIFRSVFILFSGRGGLHPPSLPPPLPSLDRDPLDGDPPGLKNLMAATAAVGKHPTGMHSCSLLRTLYKGNAISLLQLRPILDDKCLF